MASEKIIVSATDSGGNSVQRTFDNVNPDASNAQLAAFGSKIAGFSKNTYAKTDRVDKVNCDSEASATVKPTPTLTFSKTTIDYNPGGGTPNANYFTFTYNGDGELFNTRPVCTNDANFADSTFAVRYENDGSNQIFLGISSALAGKSFTFKMGATETDNFKAPEPILMTVNVLA